MVTFKTSSDVIVEIRNEKIYIDKSNEKGRIKTNSETRKMFIKLSSISGVEFRHNLVIIYGYGLPNLDVHESTEYTYPNSIQGKEEELKLIYEYLINII